MTELSEKAKEINENIQNLKYDPRERISVKGDKIDSFVPYSGKLDGSKFIVTKRTLHTAGFKYDITVPNSNRDVTYPGALLLANEHLVNGDPQPFGAPKSARTITVDLPFMGKEKNVTAQCDYASISAAIDGVLDKWFEKQPEGVIPANLQFHKDIVTSNHELSILFGLDIKFLKDKAKWDFDVFSKQKKSSYLVHFRQIYYTVSVEEPSYPAQVFSDEVDWDMLKNQINDKNPPCYVKNVAYGREIYLLLQSDLSTTTLKTHLDANLKIKNNNIDFDFDASLKDLNNHITCELITVGGAPFVLSGSLNGELIKDINNAINSGMNFTRKSPALPLCYKVDFLKGNEPAVLNGSTEYTTEEYFEYSSGSIKIIHNAAYIARLYINWIEISYNDAGEEVPTNKSWNHNGAQCTAGYIEEIRLPANAKQIEVRAEANTGLVWHKWLKFCDRQFCLVNQRTIKLLGTTLSPYCRISPDDSTNFCQSLAQWSNYRGVFDYKQLQFENSSLPCLIHTALKNLKNYSDSDSLEELWNRYYSDNAAPVPAPEYLPFCLGKTLEADGTDSVIIPLNFSDQAQSGYVSQIIVKDFLSANRPSALILGSDNSEMFYLLPQGAFLHVVPSAQIDDVVVEEVVPLNVTCAPNGDGTYGVALEYVGEDNVSRISRAKNFAMIII